MYKIKLNIDGKEQKSEGKTPLSAFNKLKAPDRIKTMSLLTITEGDKTVEKKLNIPAMKRLFKQPAYYREIFIKNLLTLIK